MERGGKTEAVVVWISDHRCERVVFWNASMPRKTGVGQRSPNHGLLCAGKAFPVVSCVGGDCFACCAAQNGTQDSWVCPRLPQQPVHLDFRDDSTARSISLGSAKGICSGSPMERSMSPAMGRVSCTPDLVHGPKFEVPGIGSKRFGGLV